MFLPLSEFTLFREYFTFLAITSHHGCRSHSTLYAPITLLMKEFRHKCESSQGGQIHYIHTASTSASDDFERTLCWFFFLIFITWICFRNVCCSNHFCCSFPSPGMQMNHKTKEKFIKFLFKYSHFSLLVTFLVPCALQMKKIVKGRKSERREHLQLTRQARELQKRTGK